MLVNKEVYKKFFEKDNKENFLNMDIGIFNTINDLFSKGEIKRTSHKMITFSYLWLVGYLWKYSKYNNMEINTKDIKIILGLSPIEKRIDYLIKKDGLLDSIGMLETTRDFPIYSNFDKNKGIEITKLSNLSKDMMEDYLKRYNSRYTCKKPLFQYTREGKVGLMFSKDDTIPISVLEFTRIVLCPDLGVEGLYVYAYIKMRNM